MPRPPPYRMFRLLGSYATLSISSTNGDGRLSGDQASPLAARSCTPAGPKLPPTASTRLEPSSKARICVRSAPRMPPDRVCQLAPASSLQCTPSALVTMSRSVPGSMEMEETLPRPHSDPTCAQVWPPSELRKTPGSGRNETAKARPATLGSKRATANGPVLGKDHVIPPSTDTYNPPEAATSSRCGLAASMDMLKQPSSHGPCRRFQLTP